MAPDFLRARTTQRNPANASDVNLRKLANGDCLVVQPKQAAPIRERPRSLYVIVATSNRHASQGVSFSRYWQYQRRILRSARAWQICTRSVEGSRAENLTNSESAVQTRGTRERAAFGYRPYSHDSGKIPEERSATRTALGGPITSVTARRCSVERARPACRSFGMRTAVGRTPSGMRVSSLRRSPACTR